MTEPATAATLRTFTVLDRGSPEEAHELAVGLMNRHRMRLGSGADRFSADIRATPVGGVSLLYFSYGVPTHIESAPLPDFATAMLPLRGRLEHAHGDERHVTVAGGGAFYSEREAVQARWSGDLELLVLRMDRAAIARKLAALTGRPVTKSVRFAPTMNPGNAALVATIRTLAEVFDRFGADGLPPIVRTEYEELLLSMLLLEHEHTLSDEVRTHAPSLAGQAVAAAIRHVEEHYAEPLTASALAEAAHVSERALYAAFQRERGLTPMAYVRRFRLERAREALIAASAEDGATVAEISLAHGFGHLGRFAASYRERYGESPSETLRR